jgi:alpha-amylase
VAPRISLALAIHNHQPVGNFGWVFAEIYEQAYEPLVAALERHPGVRLSLHYTGPLLEWLRIERPAFIARLRALVARGQVEILGGGYYEPVLASLPERDRVGQLHRMADELETLFGARPHGAWLAERVWEPSLPSALALGGYDWTILDDAHFRAASIPDERAWGAYTTEDQGHLLTLFGTEQGLRYLIPFGEVDAVIEHLRTHATEDGERLGMMGDDGEKFGAWPTTWEHCWGSGRWIERFFEALEANAGWIDTVTPTAWLASHPPIGRAYVPTGSYAEMGEWSLPADQSRTFHAILERATEGKLPERRWLRGGFWRNFQVKYREINDLHKQMLRTSEKLAAMPEGAARERALDHLYRGQSNDCYWHGLFGGVYISHMRLATFEHLIAAEDLADSIAGRGPTAALVDTDLDGIDEALLAGPGQVVVVDLAEGGAIGSWDIRAVRHALAGVLRRRPEASHALLRAHETSDSGTPAGDDGSDGTTSIHELVRVKEEGLLERIVYDSYERRSGHARFLPAHADHATWAGGTAAELGDFLDRPFEVLETDVAWLRIAADGLVQSTGGGQPVRIEKRLQLAGDRRTPELELTVTVENGSEARLAARFAIEWNLTMLGGGGNPAAWYEVEGTRSGHDTTGHAAGVTALGQGNDYIGLAVETTVAPAADAWWAPIDTVSNSENGFERVYQGSALLLSWPISLAPGKREEFRVRHVVRTTRDHALEEVELAAADGSDAGARPA